MSLKLVINGQDRVFEGLAEPATLAQVILAMELKGDRIAVEHNGEIAQRARWSEIAVASGDRLEVVHFVGGGVDAWTSAAWRKKMPTMGARSGSVQQTGNQGQGKPEEG